MKRKLKVDGIAAEIDIRNGAGMAEFEYRGGEEALGGTASVLEVQPSMYSILWEGRSYEAAVESADGALFVTVRGRRFRVEVEDPRRFEQNSRGTALEGQQRLTAPMPGRIVRVLVSEGSEVAEGQGILVIEAMKMQNEIKSPKTGRIVALIGKPGSAVAPGEVLAIVE
jgi:biotin carboxyl carrier protein